MVEVSLTVGKLDASLALLLTKDHHLIEFPTILLPNGVKAGSIVKIKCDRDLVTEKEEAAQFQQIQDEILATFGKNLPQLPVLSIKNVTQTSCVLEWDALDLGTASLKNLVLFKDDKKLGAIPQPLTNRTTKLSGLPIDKAFKFQLRLDTTAGVFLSNLVEVKTHKMTDLSGITVCLGDITPNDQFTVEDIQETLKSMGAHYPAQDKLMVDTTHFITTRENKQNPEFLKANEMNIPIIRPEWLKACELERRIVGVRDFYVKDCVLPDILAKNYWNKGSAPPKVPEKDVSEDTNNLLVADSLIKAEPEANNKPQSNEPVAELENVTEPATEAATVAEPQAEPESEAEPVAEAGTPGQTDSAEETALAEQKSSLSIAGEEIRIETFDLVPLEEVPGEEEKKLLDLSLSADAEAPQRETEDFTEIKLEVPAETPATAEEEIDLTEESSPETKEDEEGTDIAVETAVSGEPVEPIEEGDVAESADPAEPVEIETEEPVESAENVEEVAEVIDAKKEADSEPAEESTNGEE